MTRPDDEAYMRRRITEERQRASAATDATIASVHAAFATAYAERLGVIVGRARPLRRPETVALTESREITVQVPHSTLDLAR